MIINVKNSIKSYDIVLENGILENAGDYIPASPRNIIITDSGVPASYSETVAAQVSNPYIFTIPQGESSKCFDSYMQIIKKMAELKFTRSDCVIAVGGGVVGDLSGFAAATYMRGIKFVNIPTTLLSQVDSSIGGKTAIDLDSIKNIVGAFYQPDKVIIDPDTLNTLSDRLISAGLAEAIKMAATCDSELFEFIENSRDLKKDLPHIIEGALLIKKDVVEKDPEEKGLRRVLNFGHTIGHAYESVSEGALYHGEAVALGTLKMCSSSVLERLKGVYGKYSLPTDCSSLFDNKKDILMDFITHDKKMTSEGIVCVYVDEIGSFEFRKIKPEDIEI